MYCIHVQNSVYFVRILRYSLLPVAMEKEVTCVQTVPLAWIGLRSANVERVLHYRSVNFALVQLSNTNMKGRRSELPHIANILRYTRCDHFSKYSIVADGQIKR